MIEFYLVIAFFVFILCLSDGHQEYFESWFDHGLQAAGFALCWPLAIVIGGTMVAARGLCWVYKKVKHSIPVKTKEQEEAIDGSEN